MGDPARLPDEGPRWRPARHDPGRCGALRPWLAAGTGAGVPVSRRDTDRWRRARRARCDHRDTGGRATHDRLDSSGVSGLLSRVRRRRSVVRVDRPLRNRAPGLRPAEARRQSLHDARGHLRRAAGRRCHVHHPVQPVRRRARAIGRGKVLSRLLDVALTARQSRPICRPFGDACGIPAWHRVRQRRGDYGHAGFGRVAVDATRWVCPRHGWRHARRFRHRRAALTTDARRRRVPDRRVPANLVSRRPPHGNDSDGAVLPLHCADDRGRAGCNERGTSEPDEFRFGTEENPGTQNLGTHCAMCTSLLWFLSPP